MSEIEKAMKEDMRTFNQSAQATSESSAGLGEEGTCLWCQGTMNLETAVGDCCWGEWKREIDDLSMLVRSLASSLRKVAPEHGLPDRAIDYLKRKGLQGSILRNEA